MKVTLDFSVVPMGMGVSISEYVAECDRVIRESGVTPHLHSFGTTIEGEWDEVLLAVRKCHERLHEMGVPRISTVIKLGTRTDKDQTLEDKCRSVEAKL
jgi:uncharacterized protein (TIGR00106 family)